MKKTNDKTIFFHPQLLPKIAVLAPGLTLELPTSLTVATGLDAFTHNLEAFMAPGFDPMADGIALEAMRLIIMHLPILVKSGSDIESRGAMMMAATMGATAFQKGLGMIHSLAHPLSSECGLHHGLANALVGPACIEFIESQNLNPEQKARIQRIVNLFTQAGYANSKPLHVLLSEFYDGLGIKFGLKAFGVSKDKLNLISKKAIKDVCHQTNMISVQEENFLKILEEQL